MRHPYTLALAALGLLLATSPAPAQNTGRTTSPKPLALQGTTARAQDELKSDVGKGFHGLRATTMHTGKASRGPAGHNELRGGPPANDNCAGAVTLIPGATCNPMNGDVAGATESIPSILCNTFTGDADDDVWYKFVATATAHTIEVTGSASFDAVVDLRSGACNGTNIGCADASLDGGTEQIAAAGLTVGVTYYVRVYDWYSGAPPTTGFTICVYAALAAPYNDECTGAVDHALSVPGNLTVTGDNTGATDSEGVGYGTTWEEFTTTTCATVTLDYCGTTPVFGNFFTSLTQGCPFTVVIDADNWVDCGDGNLIITWLNLPAGTYYAPVLTEPGVSQGPYTIEISASACGVGPANDDCAGAIPLTPSTTCNPTAGTVLAATQSMTAITCNGFTGTANDDVWYSFVATSTTHIIHVDGADTLDAVVQLFSGTCGSLTDIDCADATLGGGVEEIFAAGLTIGQTYYVRVYDYYTGYPLAPNFDICIIELGPAPPNDDCGSVVFAALNVGATITFTGDNTNATPTGDYVPGTLLDNGNEGSVWHGFTTTECTNVMVEYCGQAPSWSDAWLVLATSCPADDNLIFYTSFNIVDCGDNNVTIYYDNLPAGTYYFPVMKNTVLDAVGPYSIDLSATACSGGPANDDCADAISLYVELPADCPANAVTGTTIGATQDGVLPSCDLAGTLSDVWYTFNSLTNTEVTITVDTVPDGIASDYVVVVYEGCGGAEDTCYVAPPDPIVFPVQANTDYVVRVYSNLSYGAETDFTICVSGAISTNITEPAEAGWSVFPNPGNGELNIAYHQGTSDVTIELFDITGRVVHAERAHLGANTTYHLRLTDRLADGTYTLRLTGPLGSSEQRVMVK